MPPRLFRVVLQVGNVDEAAAFYGAVLELSGTRVSEGRHYFDCGGTILACFDSEREDGVPARPSADHVYIAVDDLQGARGRAKAAGADPGAIANRPWGERSFYAEDPWRNPLCFVQAGTELLG